MTQLLWRERCEICAELEARSPKEAERLGFNTYHVNGFQLGWARAVRWHCERKFSLAHSALIFARICSMGPLLFWPFVAVCSASAAVEIGCDLVARAWRKLT